MSKAKRPLAYAVSRGPVMMARTMSMLVSSLRTSTLLPQLMAREGMVAISLATRIFHAADMVAEAPERPGGFTAEEAK
jgi:hypothetical protein